MAAVEPAEAKALLGVVESKFPFTVKVEPKASYKMWTRIFRSGDVFSAQNHAVRMIDLKSVFSEAVLAATHEPRRSGYNRCRCRFHDCMRPPQRASCPRSCRTSSTPARQSDPCC